MLVSVIIIFIMCWAPVLINNVLVAFGHIDVLHVGYLKPMRQAFFLMSYSNSCVNPIVYGFMSKNFRETFKHALCTCFRGPAYVRRMQFKRQNSMQTRSTNTGYSRAETEVDIDEYELTVQPYGACEAEYL